jgi:D-alanine-D-alanine ligase
VTQKIQTLAKLAFKALSCEGMARVDFFVTPKHRIIVNELNTIPGFTQISMYPKLWIASGLSYSSLLDQLVQLALQRATQNRVLIQNKNNMANKDATV